MVYSALDVEIQRIQVNTESNWNRVKAVWKEETMQTLLDQIRGQQTALNVLLNVLQMSVSPIY
jgi:hypothetical protein